MIPSIDKGQYACQRPKWALDCVLGFGGRQPACILRPRQRQFMLAGRSFGVFRERKPTLARQTRQPGCRPATRITPPALVLDPKNRAAPCQSMVFYHFVPLHAILKLGNRSSEGSLAGAELEELKADPRKIFSSPLRAAKKVANKKEKCYNGTGPSQDALPSLPESIREVWRYEKEYRFSVFFRWNAFFPVCL